MDIYEITFIDRIDNDRTQHWTERKCRKFFGKDEWAEIKADYLPHIVAVKIS